MKIVCGADRNPAPQNHKKRPDVKGDIGLGEESAKRIFAVHLLVRRQIFLLVSLILSIHVH
jgi:hypothetical protein